VALKEDLEAQVSAIFKAQWAERDGQVVPGDASLKLGNDAIKLKATVLYADLADSTVLVDNYEKQFAAKIYKTFLHCAAKIITSENGVITAYDGDRIMAVFLGNMKNSTAVRAALKINWAAKSLIQPALKKQYPKTNFVLNHVCGIDTSDLYVAKTGIRGSNDLVWVGKAANYAAKLAALDHNFPTWITKAVYGALEAKSKLSDGVDMWQARTWKTMADQRIYCSTYHWSL
jgi:class 3 adenylate cyclase